MNPSRVFLLIVAGCCFFSSRPLLGQAAGVPFDVSKQYSAQMVITTQDGRVMNSKVYNDNGKVRSEVSMPGMTMVSIIRPDLKKMYTVVESQKMVMETSYDPSVHPIPGATPDNDAKYELVGPETVDGVACTKYKVTTKDGKVVFFWIDPSKKALVKTMPEDGSVTIVWKNFVAGPQDASLFEPPAGYKTMQMPSGVGMPGGGAPGQ
jgi:hypothetical protein